MPGFEGNRVTESGGALALAENSILELNRAAFINNGAASDVSGVKGGALYLTRGSRVTWVDDPEASVPPDCPSGPLCPRFVGNRASGGTLAHVEFGGELSLKNTLVVENNGPTTALVRLIGGGPRVNFVNNFLVRNAVSHILSGSTVDGVVGFNHNTIADNPGLESVVHLDGNLENGILSFVNNLVMAGDAPVFSGSGQFAGEIWECHVGSTEQAEPFDRQLIINNPDFADPENLDYHLGSDSGAIDVCGDPDFSDNIDIDGEPRVVDHPSRKGDLHADAGADEVQVPVERPDIVFSDRFEQPRL